MLTQLTTAENGNVKKGLPREPFWARPKPRTTLTALAADFTPYDVAPLQPSLVVQSQTAMRLQAKALRLLGLLSKIPGQVPCRQEK